MHLINHSYFDPEKTWIPQLELYAGKEMLLTSCTFSLHLWSNHLETYRPTELSQKCQKVNQSIVMEDKQGVAMQWIREEGRIDTAECGGFTQHKQYVCVCVFAMAFKVRTRTSLTRVKVRTILQSQDKICVLALWHIAMMCTLPLGV